MSRTALVLSGGGLTGAVYDIGALRALNDALLDRSVKRFRTSVIVELDEHHDRNKQLLAKHGLTVRRNLARDQLRLIKRAGYDPQVISHRPPEPP